MSDYPIMWHKTTHGFDDALNPIRDRESYLYITETGTVEGWRALSPFKDSVLSPTGYFGGIEIHSKTPLWNGQEVRDGHYEWTRGDCYHDGSSSGFEQIENKFDHPERIFPVLASWAKANRNTSHKEN